MVLQVTAVAYDNPIPGFKTNNTINLRLWAAKPDREFDLEAFNTGDYVQVGITMLTPYILSIDAVLTTARMSHAYYRAESPFWIVCVHQSFFC